LHGFAEFWLKSMKNIILALIFSLNYIQPLNASSYGNGYTYKRPITIDHTKIGSASTVVTYSTSGSYTWVAPPGVTSVSVEAWGGGGTGGPATGNPARGGGGAGGQYAIKQVAVTPGTSYTIVVAAASTAQTGTLTNGNDSTFNTNTVVAKGGAGGLVSSGTSNTGGVGSTASGVGDTVYAGGSGGAGTAGGSSGGGGGGAGSTGTGNSGVTSTQGAAKANGGGAGGAGVSVVNTNNPGNAAGGGGSGGLATSSTNRKGGNGAAGQVQLTYTDTLSNFPVLISGTYAYLKTVANGGKVTNANGYDIIFTSDAAGTTVLNYERQSYNASTGAVNFWVNVPSVSHSSDTVIYMWYEKSSVSTDQSNKNSTWDTNYKGVWHMEDNAANTSILDSTSNGNNWTNQANTSTETVAGQVGSALSYDGSANYASVPINMSSTSVVTASFWVNHTWGNNNYTLLEYSANFNSNTTSFGFFPDDGADCTAGQFMTGINGNVGYNSACYLNPSNGWHYVTVVYDLTQQASSEITLYIDGVLQTAQSHPFGSLDTGSFGNYTLYMASRGGTSQFIPATMDDVRVSFAARQVNWTLAEFNNQNSPSTFYTIGSETTGDDTASFASE
jgi:hypothetical protein